MDLTPKQKRRILKAFGHIQRVLAKVRPLRLEGAAREQRERLESADITLATFIINMDTP